MKKKLLTGTIIVIIIALLALLAVARRSGNISVFGGGRAYEVEVEALKKGEISSSVSANGFVEAIERAEVYFDTPLKVVKLYVQKNQRVAKGQKLLELDMDSLRSELEKLKLNRQSQELALDAKAMEAEITRAKSSVESAERAYDEAKKAYERNKSLYEADAISSNEFEMSQKALLDAENVLKNAKAAYDAAVSAKNLDSQTKNQNLKLIDLNIADIEKRIQKTEESALSPMDGVIAAVNVIEGSYTGNMQPAFVVVNPDKLQVKANVREYDIRHVKVGQDVKITGDAIGDDKEVTGKVESISPIAVSNRTTSGEEVVVEVVISIEPPDADLKPGFSVSCDIFTVDKKEVLVAPMEMFDEDKDGNKFAYVVDKDTRTMKKTPVKLGISSDMYVEVLEGLKEGDLVILNPKPVYRDGARVRIVNQY